MLTLDCFSNEKSAQVLLAILFAEDTLLIFEKQEPKDLRPRKAIEAAQHWLKVRTEEAATASVVAACDAHAAAYAAAADIVVDAANAAYAAYAAADAAAYPYGNIYTAAYAAAAAAATYGIYKQNYIHSILLKHLDEIIQFHLDENLKLQNSEEVFNHLNEKQKENFIFSLNILR
jgi:hypothetical protein